MSLNWNVTKVKDSETVCFTAPKGEPNREIRSVTHNLIFATMLVGMGEITNKNYVEFYERLRVARAIWELDPISFEAVKAHIGLYTNADRWTMPAFMKRLREGMEDNIKRRVRRDLEDFNELVEKAKVPQPA